MKTKLFSQIRMSTLGAFIGFFCSLQAVAGAGATPNAMDTIVESEIFVGESEGAKAEALQIKKIHQETLRSKAAYEKAAKIEGDRAKESEALAQKSALETEQQTRLLQAEINKSKLQIAKLKEITSKNLALSEANRKLVDKMTIEKEQAKIEMTTAREAALASKKEALAQLKKAKEAKDNLNLARVPANNVSPVQSPAPISYGDTPGSFPKSTSSSTVSSQ